MHLCYEIQSLILLPLLSPLATAIILAVIVVILNLVIIPSPALPFCARRNSACHRPFCPN
jgi:hypothetical protein